MSNFKSHNGYSLIELVLAMTLMIAVFAVFGTFLSKLIRGAAKANETAKVTEDSTLATNILQSDFEALGRNLTMPVNQIFAGTMRIPFYPSSEFSYNPLYKQLTRINSSGNQPAQMAVSFRGTASISAACNYCSITVTDAEANHSWELSRFGQSIQIHEDGTIVKELSSYNNSNQLSISFSGIYSQDSAINCTTTYRLDTDVLEQSTTPPPCTNNFKKATFDTNPGSGGITNPTLIAGEIQYQPDSISTPSLFPVFPQYQSDRMTTPCISGNNSFLLFNTAPITPMILKREQIMAQSSEPELMLDNTAGIGVGDILFLMDFLNNRSVLLLVKTIDGNIVGSQRIDGSSPASLNQIYQSFQSSVDDFSGDPFPAGSRLVKLNVIEYAVRTEKTGGDTNASTGLFRREVGKDWQLVLPNISDFSITPHLSPSVVSYEISFNVLSEGFETSQKRENLHLTINPRALNRTFDVR